MSDDMKHAAQAHLHTAVANALEGAGRLNRAMDSAYFDYGSKHIVRLNIESAREYLRSCMEDLDAFEAEVWPSLQSAVTEPPADLSEHERLNHTVGLAAG